MFTISNSNGITGGAWAEEYDTQDDALDALCEAFGIDRDEAVTSDSYAVDEGNAVSVYATEAECEADQDGAYAPRIVRHDPPARDLAEEAAYAADRAYDQAKDDALTGDV